jgi:hypothetical protein
MAHYRTYEVYEVFDLFTKTTNNAERVALLQKHVTPALRDVLRGTFDDRLVWILPEGTPPYTPNRPESSPQSLHKAHKEFGYYVKGGYGNNMNSMKRESMFMRMLESVHPSDANIILSMVAKKRPVKYLNKKLTQETFPNLIP